MHQNNLSLKGLISLSLCSIIFFACQKNASDTESQSTTTESITTTTATDDPSIVAQESQTARTGNQSPNSWAGLNQEITLPVNSITLDGSGSNDPDGSIASYNWTKEVGPAATITSATSAVTTVTALTGGDYRFKLTVTDNRGATASDTIHITVKGNGTTAPVNQPPVVNAGAGQTITLPVSSVTLSGSATDPDGTIASYLWTKTSGTGGTITTPNAATTTVTGLTAGSYIFNLKATDNAGATGNMTIAITVNSATPPANQIPVVNAGLPKTITLPVSSVTLIGSATDADGTIVSYLWTKTSGTGGIITTPNTASTTVLGLSAGSYIFNLKATDNAGGAGNKTVTITVAAAPANQIPVVNAGSPITITLPVSSATLSGSANDPDGTISSYLWTKISGTGGTITNPNSSSTTVTGLVAGSYVFNLKATDNAGAAGNKTVTVTVNAAAGTPPGNYGTLIFSTGYNQLSDIMNGSGQQGNGGLSTTIYKTGPGSFKSVPANVSSGIRSEVQYDESQTPIEGVVEYDVLYEVVAPNYCHSIQFHPNSYDGSSALGMWHSNGKFDVTRWYGGNNYHQTGTLQTIQTNRWYNMRVEYKFNNTTGYYRWYIDNVLYFSYTGQVGDGSGQYLKVGVNMWVDQPSVVYYDNLKIWRK